MKTKALKRVFWASLLIYGLAVFALAMSLGCQASVTAGGAKASTEHVVDRPAVTTRTLEGTNIDPAVAQAFFNLGKKK